MKNKIEITILPELYVFIQSPTYDELTALEENIIRDGCREPLTVWETEGKTILVDGHNRYKICQENSIEFQTYPTHFENIEDVKKWMINNQLGRRNLTKEQQSYLRGKSYQSQKNKKGANQWDGSENTVKKLAKEHNVSEKTIQRDEKYMLAVDKLTDTMKGVSSEGTAKIFKERILSKQIYISKNDIGIVKHLDENEIKVVALELNRNEEDSSLIFSRMKERLKSIEHLESLANYANGKGLRKSRINKLAFHLWHKKLEIEISLDAMYLGFKVFHINKLDKSKFETYFNRLEECDIHLKKIISEIVFGEKIESDIEIIDSILEKFPEEKNRGFRLDKVDTNRAVLSDKGGIFLLRFFAENGNLFYESEYGKRSNVVEYGDVISCIISIIEEKDKEEAIEVECDLEKPEIEGTTESIPYIQETEKDETNYFDRKLMQEWHALYSEMPFPGQKSIVGIPSEQYRYFRGSSDFLWAECAKLINEQNKLLKHIKKQDKTLEEVSLKISKLHQEYGSLEKQNKELMDAVKMCQKEINSKNEELYELKFFKYHTVNNFISFPNFRLDDANLLRDIEKNLQEKGYNPTFVNVENLGYLNIYLDSQKWDIGSHEGVEELIGIVKECSVSYQKKLIKPL